MLAYNPKRRCTADGVPVNRLIIGIGGLKRSGKDELARAIISHARQNGVILWNIAFADALRDTAAAAYGVPVNEFSSDQLKDEVHPAWGITRRQMLINLGVPATLLPPAGVDHWVRRWQQSLSDLPMNTSGVIAADIRRTNEAAAVHDMGGVNILVRRPGITWNGHITEKLSWLASTARGSYNYGDAALHEMGSAGQRSTRPVFDLVIDNDGSVSDLHAKASQLYKAVLDVRRHC